MFNFIYRRKLIGEAERVYREARVFYGDDVMDRSVNGEYFTLITGASSGIGRALAFECARRHMNLFLVSLPETGLEEVAAEITAQYPVTTRTLTTDLTCPESYLQVYDQARARGIRVNNLINNAGIGYNGYLKEMDPQKVDQMILLNLRATTLITSVFLKELTAYPRSHILNICSMAAFLPVPGKSVYSASKAYTLFFSKSLRAELRHTGVSVTAVCPWGVRTSDAVRERIQNSGVVSRTMAMDPEEVARVSVEAMLRRKSVVIPGHKGRLFFYLGQIVPQGIVLRVMENELRKALHE